MWTLAQGQRGASRIVAHGDRIVWSGYNRNSAFRSIMILPRGGGTPYELVSRVDNVGAVAAGDCYVSFTSGSDIWRVPY